MGSKLDITNKKFGKLTALKEIGKTKTGALLWSFKCDCGKTSTHESSRVYRGQSYL